MGMMIRQKILPHVSDNPTPKPQRVVCCVDHMYCKTMDVDSIRGLAFATAQPIPMENIFRMVWNGLSQNPAEHGYVQPMVLETLDVGELDPATVAGVRAGRS